VQTLDLSDHARSVLDFGLDALTYGTAWARVESGFHFPSDTLIGMALGNFTGPFFNDAFLKVDEPSRLSVTLAPLPGGAQFRVMVSFN